MRRPRKLSYEEAADIPIAGRAARRLLSKGNSQRGQKVMIYGASGSVGTYAVQIAKSFGSDVTGVCSTANLEKVRSLGADRVIDYTKGDIAASEERYDTIFDTVAKLPKAQSSAILAPTGSYVTIARLDTKQTKEELTFLKELAEAGNLQVVIDRCYPMEQMAEAHRYVDLGQKMGNVVITVG